MQKKDVFSKSRLIREAVVIGIVVLFFAGSYAPAVQMEHMFIGEIQSVNPINNQGDALCEQPVRSFFQNTISGDTLSEKGQAHPLSGERESSWWNTEWGYRKKITIDHSQVAGNLAGFPVLISLASDTDISAHAQADGDDVVLTDDGGDVLAYELEYYDDTTGALVAWVNVTGLSNVSDTVLYLYYGNPSCESQENPGGVWDAGYVMVQHLNETSGVHYDSSSYGNDGTCQNGVTQNSIGQIDGADEFDGVDDYVDVGDLDADGNWTVSFWVKSSQITFTAYYPIGLNNNRGIGFGGTDSTYNDIWVFDGTNAIHSGFSPSVNTWYYVCVVKNGTQYTLYVNGVSASAGSLGDIDISDLNIGCRSDGFGPFDGTIDEVRVSAVIRSNAWIQTKYLNQVDPDSFLDVGAEDTVGNDPVSIADVSPVNGASEVLRLLSRVSFTVLDPEGEDVFYQVSSSPDFLDGVQSGTVASGSTVLLPVEGLLYDTVYTWSVNASDGGNWTNETFSFTTESAAAWFDLNWSYRQSFLIDNTGGDLLADYQVRLVLNSSNFMFSEALPDGSDLRVTDADGTTLIPYYIESFNGSSEQAVVWVKLPCIPADDAMLVFVYYGCFSPKSFDVPPTGMYEKYDSNPVLSSGSLPENIVYDNATGEYWCVYWGGSNYVYLAHSPDLVHWTAYAGNPILTPNSSSWDSNSLGAMHLQYYNGTYYLFYCGHNISETGDHGHIGIAMAENVTGPYVRYGSTPVLYAGAPGSWDSYRVDEPYVFQDDDGTWVMFFMGETGATDEQIGYATAPNITGPWTKYGANPVLAFGPAGTYYALTLADAFVYKMNGVYYVFYSASHTKSHPWINVYATTTDLENFTQRNVVVGLGSDGAWDADNSHRGAVSRFGDYYYMSYTGYPYKFGMAKQYAKNTAQGYPADQVFDFYDEFTDDELLDHMRDAGSTGGGYSISDGVLTVHSGNGTFNQVMSVQEFRAGYLLEARTRHPDADGTGNHAGMVGFATNAHNEDPLKAVKIFDGNTSYWMKYAHNTATSSSAMMQLVDTEWHIHRIGWASSTLVMYQNDNHPWEMISSNVPSGTYSAWVSAAAGSGYSTDLEVDWLRVRKYAAVEPVVVGGLLDVSPAPAVSDVSPADGSINVSLSLSEVSCWLLSDVEDESMEYWVDTVPDIGSAHDTVIGDSFISVPVSGLTGETTYTWFVNVTDGSYETNRSFSFTTEADLPLIRNESPPDGSMVLSFNPTLQAEVLDLQGDSVAWSICSNASGSWATLESGTLPSGSGAIAVVPTAMTAYDVTYYWSVNVTDAGSGDWMNETFCFGVSRPLSQWIYRKAIVINHSLVPEDVVDFPMLVEFEGDGDLVGHVQSGFEDVLFMDGSVAWMSGSACDRFAHEIERGDSGLGDLIAWVKVPFVSSSADTVFYMYYGNPSCDSMEDVSGTWNSEYVMVQHLEETAGTHEDSTSYGFDGVAMNGTGQDATGYIDGADNFDGVDDYVAVGDLDVDVDWTVSFWAKSDASTDPVIYPVGLARVGIEGAGIGMGGTWNKVNNDFYVYDGNYIPPENSVIHGGPSIVLGTWYYVTVVKNNSLYTIYVNGTSVASGVLNDAISISNLTIGKRPDAIPSSTFGGYFDGVVDEVRVSRSVRSARWIQTKYDNQYNLESFFDIGIEELDTEAPVAVNEFPDNGSSGVTLNPILSVDVVDFQGDTVTVYFMSNASGNWNQIGTEQSGGNDTYTQATSTMNKYDEMYWWSVNVTDSHNNWTNHTYHFTTEVEYGAWWNPNWLYRRSVTINHTKVFGGSSLLNFPLLIDLVDVNLSTKAQSDGDDFVFTDCYAQQFSHEIEFYDDATGHLIAWVNVTSLSSSEDTMLYLYYGNTTCDSMEDVSGAWNSEYAMVQHLEETAGTHWDSTSYGFDGVAVNGTVQNAAGYIDGADNFDGVDDYVAVGDLDVDADWTVSFWAKSDTITKPVHYPIGIGADHGIGMGGTHPAYKDFYVYDGVNSVHSGSPVVTGVWYYVCVVKNGLSYSIFVNGSLAGSGTLIDLNIDDLNIGRRSNNFGHVDSTIDEVRVSRTVRSAGWIQTKYLNQVDPASFVEMGMEEEYVASDVIAPVITAVTVEFSTPKDTVIGWENITCQVTDNTHVDQVKVNLTYPDLHTENVSMMKSGDLYYYNTTLSATGSYSYFIWANDTSDNRNVSGVDGFVLPPNWDITGDGVCNGLDVTPISLSWLYSGDAGWVRADINNDGFVNGLDVTFISLHWLETWS